MLAQVLDRANLQRALKQVRRNQGAPGIDGMSVDELPEYLKEHWLGIRAQLESGHYRKKISTEGFSVLRRISKNLESNVQILIVRYRHRKPGYADGRR